MNRATRLTIGRRLEGGYMVEYPLILAGTILVLAVVLPRMTYSAAKFVLPFAALPVLVALYYMLIAPGWQPNAKRLGPPWNWIVFLGLAGGIVAGIVILWTVRE